MMLPLSLAALALPTAHASPEPGYLRYPDIHGDSVLFTAEDDLWIADISESPATARRLTRDEGSERYGRFSADGATIAFTAHYDGNSEVFVIAADGGEPRRVTWHPSRDEVIDWLPDGRLLFRSGRASPHGDWELYAVPVDASGATGLPERLPLGWASRLAEDPETGMWAFNRLARETSTWKRYRGGTAQDIWIGNPERADFRKLTDFDGADAFPMWHAGRVWFASDRGGTMNLWSCTPEGKLCKQHTDNASGDEAWDLRYPAAGPGGQFVYMLAGDIALYDAERGEARALDIALPSDRDLTRARYPWPGSYLTWANISPDGERVLYVTRGEIFSVPVEDGVTLPIAAGSGARESWASFGPDGDQVVYVTDAGGEESIVTADAWGRGQVNTVEAASERGWHFPPMWSPHGDRVAWSDESQTLWYAPADGSALPTQVDQSEQEEIREYSWSPDGRWLAYTLTDRLDFGTVWLYDTVDGSRHPVTGPTTDDHSPAWDPEGRYLYFIGERFRNPLLGDRDFQYVTVGSSELFMVLLTEDEENPLLDTAGAPPVKKSKKAEKAEKAEKKAEKKEDKREEKDAKKGRPKPVDIDLDGLIGRTLKLPVTPGDYGGAAANADGVYFAAFPTQGMAEWGGDDANTLMVFDLESREAQAFASGVNGYELSGEGEHVMLMRGGGSISVVDAGSPPGSSGIDDGELDLSGVVLALDPAEEWRQIFREGWRHMRDFHWDQDMEGLDWEALYEQYAALLPRLATRDDLRDLMGELIGELATSHTYVWGGDQTRGPSWWSVGLLGAELSVRDGYWRVDRILQGDPADGVRSPLSVPGATVFEGEYILAVNNQPLDTTQPYPASLEGLAGKPVLLTVNDAPTKRGARQVVITPISDEAGLRYADWVRGNREYVAAQTDGAIGYLHIPDMGTRGMIEFDRWFYPQLQAEGLVVDARWNGGGFVSQLMLERLRREVLHFGTSRGGGLWTYPDKVLNGPFVVLTNEHAGSDGDIFPASVQYEALAPVIGMRSWGGVVGIRSDKEMTDGGMLTQPEYSLWHPTDGWVIENHGVDPDIEVQNLPQELAVGVDAQLDRGIEEVLRLREETPPLEALPGAAPDKSRDAFMGELE